jgi:hypothetical protein
MKILALFMLFAWPWGAHVEKFKDVVIQPNGIAIVHFKKFFDKDVALIHCEAKGRFPVTHRSTSREWTELWGKPGDVVTGSCK